MKKPAPTREHFMKNGIPVSQKYGVNPSVQICFYCKQAIGVALFGKLHASEVKEMFGEEFVQSSPCLDDPNDVEAPCAVVLSLEPCEDCPVFYPHSKYGVFLIECDERDVEVQEYGLRILKKIPQPTGNVVVMKDEAIRRLLKPGALVEDVLKTRIAQIDRETWAMLGLNNAPKKLIEPEGWTELNL
jgi:hypothetical protein